MVEDMLGEVRLVDDLLCRVISWYIYQSEQDTGYKKSEVNNVSVRYCHACRGMLLVYGGDFRKTQGSHSSRLRVCGIACKQPVVRGSMFRENRRYRSHSDNI